MKKCLLVVILLLASTSRWWWRQWRKGKDTERPLAKDVNGRSCIQRTDFIKDILGYPEEQLIKDFDFQKGVLTDWEQSKKADWVGRHDARAAIFQGKFETKRINELPTSSGGKGSFTVRVYNPQDQKECDVRYLASHPDNKYAVFQSASTLWCLEGGMFASGSTSLADMLRQQFKGKNLQS